MDVYNRLDTAVIASNRLECVATNGVFVVGGRAGTDNTLAVVVFGISGYGVLNVGRP